ncbi:polyprenyl synthetase family protein [Amycolatopsis aidingensis]|uniref:polyprenyl synthetase family protein n=1 Tax=Amycolatopsis aidingensis TaxID=2842453 RepID=UPI001C0BFC98|nr:polyprenyl synthetase family protein [Amycolatopsis aidingensis]
MTTTRVDVEAVLRRARAVLYPALREAVDTLPAPHRAVARYHFGWCDENGVAVRGSPGKAVRPAVAFLACEAVGTAGRRATAAAVAVELAHNFSLLHDDVIDADLTRRHRTTVWSMFGIPTAILTGSALMALGVQVLAAASSPSAGADVAALTLAVQRLLEGQAIDSEFEDRTDVELSECVAMSEAKTAALLGCSALLGARAGGGTDAQVAALRDFGEHLGLVFQLVDDLLGIWGDPAATGKPVRSDLRAYKKSLPVVAALCSGTRAGQELAELYFRESEWTENDLELAAELVDQAGGRSWVQREVARQLDLASACLTSADLAPRAVVELDALATMLAARDA